MPEIIIKDLTKMYGKTAAVDHLNLHIPDRSFITLLGPSGCGKTTTLRMIAGLETPTSGEIIINGQVVFSSEKGIDVPPEKRNVGFLFQNYALWPHMTVYENITFGLENMGWDKAKCKARAEELLEMLKIKDYGDRYPAELSGGQQQRVAIARTLAPGPKSLFMDEPLSTLDAKLRMEMRTELKRLHMETDSTFVYVTHDQLEAMTLSTKICLLKLGRLQQYAPPLEVYKKPVNTFVADFIGSPNINLVPVKVEAVNGNEATLRLAGGTLKFTAATVSADAKSAVDQRASAQSAADEIAGAAETANGLAAVQAGADYTLGLRPENIVLTKAGGLPAKIYSTLPSGMETVVRLDLEGIRLTAVVFGSVDFAVNETVQVAFSSPANILFDAAGKNVAAGKVE
jgi:multiple sugar transport system ATP-binding protein